MMRFIRPYRAALMAAAVALAGPAQAGGLLEFLFGPDEPAHVSAPPPPQYPPRARAAKGVVGGIRLATPGSGLPNAEQVADGFCVRTCDGYYFPLIKSSNATRQQSCEFACPSAPMEIYEGSSIEQARNHRGERYASLANAFSFRDKAKENCSCNNPASSQAFFVKLASADPTLRSGDVVVEPTGAFVYSGKRLVPLARADISSHNRARLRDLLSRNRRERPEPHGAIELAPPDAAALVSAPSGPATAAR